MLAVGLALGLALALRAQESLPGSSDSVRGLPLTRYYPFEEIGDVSRGAHLGFDAFDRLAVVQNGAYIVLNDATWLDVAEHTAADPRMLDVVRGEDGAWYYGALAGWGAVERTPEGKLHPRSLVPEGAPKWVRTTNFSQVLGTSQGMCFGGWSGVVFFDYRSRANAYVAVPEVSVIFRVGDKVFASAHNHGIVRLDFAAQAARAFSAGELDDVAVDHATNLDDRHVLLSSVDGRLFLFDGEKVRPWATRLGASTDNRILALTRLVDGGVAIAINGRGLTLVSAQGDIVSVFDSPEFHRVTDLANREPGVLWVAAENGVEKVLYGSPVTIFGQRLGLPVSWPQIVSWNGRLLVASGGRVYEAVRSGDGGPSRFQPMKEQPAPGPWAIAASGARLLLGNAKGVVAFGADGHVQPVSAPLDVARLVMVSPDLCYVIGIPEIAVLRWTNGEWRECAPRVPGVGYPSIVHAIKSSAWIELGPNRAARIALHGDHLETRVFENFPWPQPHWVNIGWVDNLVVLTGPEGQRVFFDENAEAMCAAPELERRLRAAPFPIARIRADAQGTLWATHERGVFTITREGGRDRFDTARFDIIDDHTPLLQLLPGGDVWLSSGQSLYHVDRRSTANLRHTFSPVLISVTDGVTHHELAPGLASGAAPSRLAYAHNNLSLRFFAGSYAYRRPPEYRFMLNGHDEWARLDSGSVLSFPGLREGAYRLEVSLADSRGVVGPANSFAFVILPPWYRAWYSYVGFGALAAAVGWVVLRWAVRRTRARNLVLEQLVAKRTEELKATMEKLQDETRNAATLAERNRLAGEIHDSLQQGLSGLMLNLDSTLKLPGISADVRSRLNVARNMVSFTRHEVQHAVWGLESPLLESTELAEALRRITTLINSGSAQIEVTASGAPAALSSSTKHHLLRIAQEAITNAVRHSGAANIRIQLDYQPSRLTVTVTDDGCGFDPTDLLTHGIHHFGLRGLRGRAAKIGGNLTLRSAPGQGTTLSIAVETAETLSPAHHAVTRTS